MKTRFLPAYLAFLTFASAAHASTDLAPTLSWKSLHLSYFGSAYNRDPGFGGEKLLGNTTTDRSETVGLWSLATIGYRILGPIHLELQPQWSVRVNPSRDFALGNPRAGFSWSAYSANGTWSYSGDVNVEFPITDSSQELGVGLSPGSYQILAYRIPGSHLTVGSHGWFRLYPRSIPGRWIDFFSSVGPFAEYSILPGLSAHVIYWMSFQHLQGDNPVVLANASTEIQPGISWNATNGLTLRPFLGIRPVNESLSKAVSGGVWIMSKLY